MASVQSLMRQSVKRKFRKVRPVILVHTVAYAGSGVAGQDQANEDITHVHLSVFRRCTTTDFTAIGKLRVRCNVNAKHVSSFTSLNRNMVTSCRWYVVQVDYLQNIHASTLQSVYRGLG